MPGKSWLIAIRGRGRSIDDPPDTVQSSAFENVEGAIEVAFVTGSGVFYRTWNRGQCSLVEDEIDSFAGAVDRRSITEVAFMKFDPMQDAGKIAPAAGHEVVESADCVST